MRFLLRGSYLFVLCVIAMPCLAAETGVKKQKDIAPDQMIGDTGRPIPAGVIGDTGRSTPAGVIGDSGRTTPTGVIGDPGRAAPTGMIGDSGRTTPTGMIGDSGRTTPTGMIGDSGRPKQTRCPVSGKAIDRKVFVDYKGQRVYFSNLKYVGQFKKDPDKYMKRLNTKDYPMPEPPPREAGKWPPREGN